MSKQNEFRMCIWQARGYILMAKASNLESRKVYLRLARKCALRARTIMIEIEQDTDRTVTMLRVA